MLRLRCGRPHRGRQPRAERSGRRRADVRRGPSLPGMVTRVHHPRGVTAVFNGNLAMATPEGNSVFVGGSESTLGRPGVRGRVREGPRTNGKSKCSETRPMGAGCRQIESVALCVWQCHLRNVSTLSNRTHYRCQRPTILSRARMWYTVGEDPPFRFLH